ncbi:MAG: YihY/virulence factor BrkB family protein [Gracilimonas sp.]|nr:YihY/virulence factor BrkB family protein [Gracilimonas sp.]
MQFLKKTYQILAGSINGFIDDNGFQHSAAVSFYTLFSLAPIVMIAVFVAGFFVGNENVLVELTQFLNETIGAESTQAVMLLIETIQTDTRNLFYLFLSIGFLVVSATTVFIQFKDSFNRIFQVKARSDVGILKMLLDRLIAFGMIILLGIAMIASLIMDSLLAAFSNLLLADFESAQLFLIGVGGNALTLLLIFFAVLVMFYFLPDVKIRSRPLFAGSLITTLLLVIGKFGVGMIIGNSSLNQLTGASASIIILMLWVYYSSIIIFFGIELVKTMAESWIGEIQAGKYAQKLKLVEIPKMKKESTEE